MPDTATIYALSDPGKPDVIRYIGKTFHGLRKRLYEHVQYSKRRNNPKNAWVQSLVKRRLKPRIWPLEICEKSEWIEREKFWIRFFKTLPKFLNLTEGGNSGPNMTGYHHTEEAKLKIAEASRKQKGIKRRHKFSKESIEKIRQSMLGVKRGPSPLRGIKKSPEVIAKNRLAVINSPKWIASMKHRIGVKRTPQTILNIQSALSISQKWRDSCWKKVLCITTGQTFSSISNAARFIGVSPIYMSRQLKTGWKIRKLEWKII